MNKFYIYVYLDTRDAGNFCYGNLHFPYRPFYVGKGSGGRFRKHLEESYNKRDENDHKCNVIRKIKRITKEDPQIVKIFENLTEEDAFIKEIEIIKLIGRQDLKTGPLTNKAEGGVGFSGFKLKPESIEKMRKSLIIYFKTHKNPFSGKKHSKESKLKMSKPKIFKNGNPNIGRVKNKNERNKISISVKNSKKYQLFVKNSLIKYILISPAGDKFNLTGQEELNSICKNKMLSFYSLLKYITHIVPNYKPGIGIGTKERLNTNGWMLTKEI